MRVGPFRENGRRPTSLRRSHESGASLDAHTERRERQATAGADVDVVVLRAAAHILQGVQGPSHTSRSPSFSQPS